MIKANIFINKDVLNKLLNGLSMNNITIMIDTKEQRQIVLVWSLYPEISVVVIIIIIIIIYFFCVLIYYINYFIK
jgi:hypothetical protein